MKEAGPASFFARLEAYSSKKSSEGGDDKGEEEAATEGGDRKLLKDEPKEPKEVAF